MERDDLARENILKYREIGDVLFHLDNSLSYIEAILGSWFSQRSTQKDFQKQEAARFIETIKKLETTIGSKIVAREKLQELLQSEVRDDWIKLLRVVLPAVRTEVLVLAQNALYSLDRPIPPAWADLLPPIFAEKVLPPFRTGQYLSAVRRGCDALRGIVRAKTGLHGLDGADLINQAYGKDRQFAVAVWEGHSDENVQRGYTDMLRGAMTGIRNPHYHGTEEIPEAEAARLLVVLGTLWARAESTTEANPA